MKNVDSPIKSGDFGTLPLLFAHPATDVGKQDLRCVFDAWDTGVGQKGVPATVNGIVFDSDGNQLQTLSTRTRKTDVNGSAVFTYPLDNLPQSDFYFFSMQVIPKGTKDITTLKFECSARDRIPCSDSNTNACLDGGKKAKNRFGVEVISDSGDSASVISFTKNEARFSFTNQNTADLIVRTINGCRTNGHYWIDIFPVVPNPGVDVNVRDFESGDVRTYKAFVPIQDTAAFATCP
ncbi:hypothetical protein L0222_22760 [bacterium]|nr:hypothetical protein [bacterium]MCI0601632.1 hypothetical protein [bacterium]